jgi:MFS family permease
MVVVTLPSLAAPAARRRAPRFHRAWVVAAVTFLALVAAAAFRSSTGVLLEPVEDEFGWSRTDTSTAVSLNLVVYGLTAPFAAALMERFGIRRVVALALALVAAGAGLTLVMTQSWHLLALWGIVVGVGTGSMALVFGAVVANRWFVARRGLVTGVFSAASATGQLAFLPLIARLAQDQGWRTAAALTAVLALALVPLVLWLLADRPQDAGLRPYGDEEPAGEPPAAAARPSGGAGRAARAAVTELTRSSRSRVFWILAATFFVCGWSTNGLIGTHFIAAAHDHAMPATTAASLLALIGIFDIVGTVGSGWLSDRVDPRLLLLMYYGLRGLSLLAVPVVLGPAVDAPLLFFVVFYGLDWVATVPPTVALCRTHFGLERAGVVFGWVFASHMVGAGVAAGYAGFVRDTVGTYEPAWWTAGGLCLAAAVAVLTIPALSRSDPAPIPAGAR